MTRLGAASQVFLQTVVGGMFIRYGRRLMRMIYDTSSKASSSADIRENKNFEKLVKMSRLIMMSAWCMLAYTVCSVFAITPFFGSPWGYFVTLSMLYFWNSMIRCGAAPPPLLRHPGCRGPTVCI